jgi:hypothetical protein
MPFRGAATAVLGVHPSALSRIPLAAAAVTPGPYEGKQVSLELHLVKSLSHKVSLLLTSGTVTHIYNTIDRGQSVVACYGAKALYQSPCLQTPITEHLRPHKPTHPIHSRRRDANH